MTDWRAVAWGTLVFLVVAAFGTAIPVVGQIGAGLLGGAVAGYLAGGGLGNGAYHGLIAGSVTGVAFTVLFALFGGLLGLAAGPLGGCSAARASCWWASSSPSCSRSTRPSPAPSAACWRSRRPATDQRSRYSCWIATTSEESPHSA